MAASKLSAVAQFKQRQPHYELAQGCRTERWLKMPQRPDSKAGPGSENQGVLCLYRPSREKGITHRLKNSQNFPFEYKARFIQAFMDEKKRIEQKTLPHI